MKKIFYAAAFFIAVTYIFFISNYINYKDTEWIENSPKIIDSTNNSVVVCFAVSEPATIYWRLYKDESLIPKSTADLTNINTTNGVISYGGNITHSKNESYTNTLKGIIPKTKYYLVSIAVSSIGNFPKNMKKILIEIP